jgi:nucleobase:cation symporter-1, NCS1 family
MSSDNKSVPTDTLYLPNAAPNLINHELAPLQRQTWGTYNIFCYWMSDVHSVGGYVFAGSLFAFGLASWQVLISLLVGIQIVRFVANKVAKPSQKYGVPYPVICRSPFGVLGANIPAIIRGGIAVGWYGIQTYLASHALVVLSLKIFPALAPYADKGHYGYLGLSALGWAGFIFMWLLQAVVFWNGMEMIKKFVDFAGPAVYLVMFLLTGWMLYKGGLQGLKLNLSEVKYHGWDAIPMMITSIALVAGYYAGPVLNFGDFTRYCKSYEAVKRGNTWGLPINYLAFAIVTVITISLTVPVFGEMITDPVDVVGRLDSVTAVLLGALTFVVATIGINIVANFVPPAFDITNIAPSKISWRMGGMIAATLSVFTTPWNLFSNPAVIHYTIDVLACAIGPLYGILLVDYYVIKKEQIVVEDLYSMAPTGRYWYQGGVNLKAVYALIPASIIGFTFTTIPPFNAAKDFSLFIGAGLGALFYFALARNTALVAEPVPDAAV